MRKHHKYALLLVYFFLAMFLLSGCGGTDQHANATATAATPSESLVLETSKTLSLVRASDGSILWSLPTRSIDQPLAVADHRVYYSNDRIVAAVDLTSGRQIWSTPITIGVSDIQVSGKMVYVLNRTPSDTLLSAFDVTSDALKWHDDLGYSPSNNQILLSGQTIYTAVSGVFTALDATTGSEQWHFVPPILNDGSPPDIVSFDLSADHSMLVLNYGEALYGVYPDSHQQAWQLAPTSPDAAGSPSYDMLLSWFKLTPDDHILLSASFHVTSSFLAPQFEYRYLALSTGAQVWSLSLTAQEQAIKEGNGQAFLVGSSAFYAIGGPSQGNISATMLSTQNLAWKVPSSGSYGSLYLPEQDVLLAYSDGTLTALDTADGMQLWQKGQFSPSLQAIIPVGQRVFLSLADSIVALNGHSGRQLWSLPTPNGPDGEAGTLQNVIDVKS